VEVAVKISRAARVRSFHRVAGPLKPGALPQHLDSLAASGRKLAGKTETPDGYLSKRFLSPLSGAVSGRKKSHGVPVMGFVLELIFRHAIAGLSDV
jgi:hypothetical protein